MNPGERLARVARTDTTFELRAGLWVGKCLICNGPVAFDACTGVGATLEHIRARTRGGTDEPANLAVVHDRCNGEKGRRWDPRRRRSEAEYEAFIARLLARRQQRWRGGECPPERPVDRGRGPGASGPAPSSDPAP